MIPIKNRTFFCSWSGGKDSCLAFYRAVGQSGRPRFLLTMLTEDGQRSRSHALPINLLQKQASALGIQLIVRSTSWDDYEKTFISTLLEFKKDGVQAGVFGDIDLEAHRQWTQRVCSVADIQSYQPLWKESRRDLLDELVGAGFKATIVAVKNDVLDKQFLGKTLDTDAIREIEKTGIDICGEEGEYHTVITDGPIFSTPLELNTKKQILRDGYWFLEVDV